MPEDVYGIAISRVERQVEDSLPILIHRRPILVVVQAASDDRGIDVAADELHQYQVAHGWDAHAADT